MKLVYVCSPYRGNIEHNTARARRYCRFAITQKAVPIAPHILFTQFLDDDIPEERQIGLQQGLELLKHCDEIWVFGERISEGMQGEIAAAQQLGIPIHCYNDRCEKR